MVAMGIMTRGPTQLACRIAFGLLSLDGLVNWHHSFGLQLGPSAVQFAAAQPLPPLDPGVVLSPNAPAIRDVVPRPSIPLNNLASGTAIPPPPDLAQTSAAASSFIRVFGNVFVDDSCQEYLYTGWNGYNELLSAGLQVGPPSSLAAVPQLLAAQKDAVTDIFAAAASAKLSVTRVFAAGGDGSGIQLQPSPGVYNETVFRGLDYVLAQAARFKIKVVFSIINNWDFVDGKGQYVAWAGVGPDEFWTNPSVRNIYMNHLQALANRVNVFTGIAWKNDPTIFSWNLYNEPRDPDNQMGPGKPGPVTAWVNEMSAALVNFDPNHMITVGEEGFFVDGSPYVKYNPSGTPSNVLPGWSGRVGQDFVAQHSSPNIAYAAIHFWPNNWNTSDPQFPALWVEGHIMAATQLGKPLVLEEFGKNAATNALGTKIISGPAALANITTTRDPVYREIYGYVERGIASGNPLRAALFWEWSQTVRFSVNSVLSTDSTFGIVKAHAALLAAMPRSIQPGCVPRSTSVGVAPPGMVISTKKPVPPIKTPKAPTRSRTPSSSSTKKPKKSKTTTGKS